MDIYGVISGIRSIIVNRARQRFYFDTPFVRTSKDADANVVPAYQFVVSRTKDSSGNVATIGVYQMDKQLSYVDLQADDDGVRVDYEIG